MVSFAYGPAMREIVLGTTGAVDLLADTIKVGLSDTTHVPDKDEEFLDEAGADDFVDGELADISGTGYGPGGFGTLGRKTLASKAVVYDVGNDRVEFDADDVVWTAIDAGTIAQAILLKEITSDVLSRIIVNIDIVPDVVTNTGDITLQFNVEGILQLGV